MAKRAQRYIETRPWCPNCVIDHNSMPIHFEYYCVFSKDDVDKIRRVVATVDRIINKMMDKIK